MTTVLNAAPARSDVPEALLAATDILCVNQTEAEVMSGKSEVEEAALALRSKGCRCVIVTLVHHPHSPPILFHPTFPRVLRGRWCLIKKEAASECLELLLRKRWLTQLELGTLLWAVSPSSWPAGTFHAYTSPHPTITIAIAKAKPDPCGGCA